MRFWVLIRAAKVKFFHLLVSNPSVPALHCSQCTVCIMCKGVNVKIYLQNFTKTCQPDSTCQGWWKIMCFFLSFLDITIYLYCLLYLCLCPWSIFLFAATIWKLAMESVSLMIICTVLCVVYCMIFFLTFSLWLCRVVASLSWSSFWLTTCWSSVLWE